MHVVAFIGRHDTYNPDSADAGMAETVTVRIPRNNISATAMTMNRVGLGP
jgi:hypothetical protein